MVTVGLIDEEQAQPGSAFCFSWLHALDLNRFNINIKQTARSAEQAANARPGEHTDVWMLRSSTLLRSHTWRALSRDTERQALKPIVAICPADDEEIGRCLAEGIAAIVLPNESPWLLAAAVHAAAARQLFVSPAVLTKHQRQLVDMINTPTCTQLAELTEREHDVLVCMAHGYSNSGIAKKLHITRATVGSHVLRILRKLGAANRTEAAAVAHKVGLVGTSSLDWEPGQGRTEAKSYPAPPVRTPARPMSSTAPAGATVRPRIPARRPAPQPTPGRISYP